MLSYDDPRLTLPDAGEGQRLQVNAGVAAMRKQPTPDATQVSQVLHGETVILHHEEGEFGLVQCEHDRYVGWVLMEALSAPALRPSHRVITGRLHTYAEPKISGAPHFVLGSGALLAASGKQDGRYIEFERAGWVVDHLVAPLEAVETDPVAVAERFLSTPYLLGCLDCLVVDCSGLVHISFGSCGVPVPRDSDMQFEWLGVPIEDWQKPGELQRGDLIFWNGHVGFMTDADTLLHANGTFMTTMTEPLRPAIARIATEYGEPIGARRVSISDEKAKTPGWLTRQA